MRNKKGQAFDIYSVLFSDLKLPAKCNERGGQLIKMAVGKLTDPTKVKELEDHLKACKPCSKAYKEIINVLKKPLKLILSSLLQ